MDARTTPRCNDDEAASAIRAVDAAFPTAIPSVVAKTLASQGDDSECDEARQKLIGKSWAEVGDDVYKARYPSIFFAGPVVVQYYVPGLLRAAVRDPDDPLAERMLMRFLRPSSGFAKPSDVQKLAGAMTVSQRKAVVDVMTFLRNVLWKHSEKVSARIDESIREYWST